MELKFSSDREKDIQNYLSFFRMASPKGKFLLEKGYFKPELAEEIRSAENEEKARLIIEKIVIGRYEELGESFKAKIAAIEEAWSVKGGGVLKALESFFGHVCNFDEVTVYFTTLPISTYGLKEGDEHFLLNIFAKPANQFKTIVHELMHFFFIKGCWSNLEREGLSKEQIDMVKEALTVYLNVPPFSNFLDAPDSGHDREKELREYLVKNCPAPKSIEEITSLVIKFFSEHARPNASL